MRFRESSPPPFLNRAAQLRFLRMIGLLLVVLVVMNFAADPQMWTWLVPSDDKKEVRPSPKDINYGVKFEEDSPLAPDAFRSQLGDAKAKTANQPAIAEAASSRNSKPTNDVAQQPENAKNYRVEIDREVLAPVTDGWFGVRHHEAHAFFTIIAKAKEIPSRLLEKAGQEVDYTVLMTDSDRYRGQPLTISGIVRRIEKVEMTKEDAEKTLGINHYFVAWMWTDSSGNSPYRLIASSLPEDMALGQDIEVPAKFTGYFFKQEGYQSQGGFHVAPVLIGQHLDWNRPPENSIAQVDMSTAPYYVVGFALVLAVTLGITLWRFKVSDRKFAQKHVEHFTTATPSDLDELNNLETNDPNELFRQLEAEAKAAESVGQDA
jgi:hypothetical protein